MKKMIAVCVWTLIAGASITVARSPLELVTTTSDIASIAASIGGDRVHVQALCNGTHDPHFVEIRPSQVVSLRMADALIIVGMGLDIWIDPLVQSSRNPRIQPNQPGWLDASNVIEKKEIPQGKVDGSMGHVHPDGNPHYWLDPINAQRIASEIARMLSRIDPESQETFGANEKAFHAILDQKIDDWTRKLAPYQPISVLTYHRSWIYFAERFGIHLTGELEPKPGVSPSPAHLRDTIERMKTEKTDLILVESFYSRKAADFVSGQTGATVLVLPNSVGGSPEATDYIALLDLIVDRLAGALK